MRKTAQSPEAILILIGLVIAGSFLFAEYRATDTLTSVSYDDSWIHFRFADNLRKGNGFSFNPGEPVSGATSPLWVVLLALLGAGFVLPAKIIGIAAYIGTALGVYYLARTFSVDRTLAGIAASLTLVIGRLAWISPSGMETSAFSCISIIYLIVWARRSEDQIPVSASVLLGCSALLRPEGYLLIALTGLDGLFSIIRRGFRWSSIWSLARHLGLAGLLISPYFLFSSVTTGNLLPTTHGVVSSVCRWTASGGYGKWILSIFFLDNPVVFPLAGAGAGVVVFSRHVLRRKGILLIMAWWMLMPVFFGMVAPCTTFYFVRYTIPVAALTPLIMVVGLNEARNGRFVKKLHERNYLLPAVGTAIIFLGVFLSLSYWAPLYVRNVSDIHNMHEEVAKWLRENTPADAVVAANDIGAIGFFSEREVFDLIGLVDTETLQITVEYPPGSERERALIDVMARRRPDYLVIFPDWFSSFLTALPLEEVYAVSVDSPSIAAGKEMVVYRLDWEQE